MKTICVIPVALSLLIGCNRDDNTSPPVDDVTNTTESGWHVARDEETLFYRVAVETNVPSTLAAEDRIRFAVLKYLIIDTHVGLDYETYFLSVGDKTDPSPELLQALRDLKTGVILKNDSESTTEGKLNSVIDPARQKQSLILYVDPFNLDPDTNGLVTVWGGWFMHSLGSRHNEYKARLSKGKITILWTGHGRIS